jgi:diaminopimelate decarboxylase
MITGRNGCRLPETTRDHWTGWRVPERVLEMALRLDRQDALPAYVYDLDALDAHAAAIRAALPGNVEFWYAVKANPDAAVLEVLARHVDGFEVSSGGELAHVARAAPTVPLSFGGPGKTRAELALGQAAGVHRFHVESPLEMAMLAATGQAADVLFRVNPAVDQAEAALVMGGTPSAFGMDVELLGRCAALQTPATRLRGLHFHVASGLGAAALLDSARQLLAFGREWCAAHEVSDPEFNLGGGMSVDYQQPGVLFDWARYGRGLAALNPDLRLRIEPGRAATAYCGWYVTRVLDVKRSHGSAFAVVAGGTHHLRTPAARGHDQPFRVVPVRNWAAPWSRPGVSAEPVTVCGQLCTPRDVLARGVFVPQLRARDLVVFGLAGAYAWNISHHGFLMHPPPAFRYLGAQR